MRDACYSIKSINLYIQKSVRGKKGTNGQA